ncbi:helix-turn-helix transcriptional regulator [Bifidobacterium callitrichidarum]|uniref:WYL domain-containing transcriptional regulator n=1 Tax=Bifidobacterium callitrichidarum TaxID=2052941 RepID=A0A2U2N6D7_9BIFI|nr:WYL domain-containing protein [Bifidobacterium callitrichidarum]PWG64700.1 WYL domain-containing transcriptional regulator [Bifidobacterium callitrichidarum]
MEADTQAKRKTYAGNATLEIFEVLWRHTYFGHGLSVRQILDELGKMHPYATPDELPTEKTVRNQLRKLATTRFLGRGIGHLTESDLIGVECADPQPGWYMDAFLSTAEMRLLADSLTLSRISLDTLDELVGKIRELAGAAGDTIDYLDHVATYTHINGEFLSTIDQLNQAIEDGHGVTFQYRDYGPDGTLVPHKSRTGTGSTYTADPYQMVYKNGRYYLICHLHGEDHLRIFVVNRITNVSTKGLHGSVPLERPAPEGFDAVNFMRHRPYPVADDPVRIRMLVRGESMLNNVFEWFDDPQITPLGSGDRFEVAVDSPERAVFWWALQYSWDGRVTILEPDSLKRKLYDAGTRMAAAYAPPPSSAPLVRGAGGEAD